MTFWKLTSPFQKWTTNKKQLVGIPLYSLPNIGIPIISYNYLDPAPYKTGVKAIIIIRLTRKVVLDYYQWPKEHVFFAPSDPTKKLYGPRPSKTHLLRCYVVPVSASAKQVHLTCITHLEETVETCIFLVSLEGEGMEITNLVEKGLLKIQEVPHARKELRSAHGSKDCQQDLDNWNLLLTNLNIYEWGQSSYKHCEFTMHLGRGPTGKKEHQQKTSSTLMILRILRVLKRSSLRIEKYIRYIRLNPWLCSSRSPRTHRVVMNCPAQGGCSMPQPPPPWVQICSTRFRTMKLCLACAGPGDVLVNPSSPQASPNM